MQLRILRTYGELKKDSIIDVTGNQKQFLLENGIACVAPVKEECKDDCDECDDCNKAGTKPVIAKKTVKKKVAKKK